jgi:hypothetical protein
VIPISLPFLSTGFQSAITTVSTAKMAADIALGYVPCNSVNDGQRKPEWNILCKIHSNFKDNYQKDEELSDTR